MSRKGPKPQQRGHQPRVEEIEPRILYSADFAPGLAPDSGLVADAEQRTVDQSGEFQHASSAQLQARRHEIVFVDPATPDYEKLIADIRAQGGEREIEVVLLDAGKDGIRKISQTLAGREEVGAVHIVSHGADGAVQLGKTSLDFDALLKNGSKIKGWGNALSADADILIYGCDVARSDAGRSLIEALARLTGADVAASDDLTGHAELGGDWELEYRAGLIDTSIVFSQSAVLDWRGILPATAAAGETRVNTSTSGTQQIDGAPTRAVAMDANGNYVVVWSGNGTQAGQTDTAGVFAQRFDASGAALGGEFRVNTSTANTQTAPSVAMDASGNFVVAWASDHASAGNQEVYGRRFAADGTALSGEFQVNTYTTSGQSAPVVGMNASGAFVVVWESSGQDGGGTGVYAQRYNAAGVAQGSEFRVNVTTAGNQSVDSVALDSAGNFVVTFANADGDMNGVYMRRYDAAGTALAGEVRVNTTTTDEQSWSTLAMDPSGNYVVVWRSVNQDGSSGGIYGQRFDASGVAQSGEFQVNTTTASDQANPAVAMDADGNFVVAWASSGQDGSLWGIYKREYDADGTANGGEVRVNTTVTNGQVNPWVAMNPDRDFVVVWGGEGTGDTAGVFMQRYSFGLVIDTVDDTLDGTVTSISALLANKGADGRISLREAITAANNTANVSGPDVLRFDIAGTHMITLGSLLPDITDSVILDGWSEPDFVGTPVIELRGGGTVANAFNVQAGGAGSTIRGFVISGFSGDAINLYGGSNLIAGNYIGTNAAGTAAAATPNAEASMRIHTGSNNNVIGGTTPLDRNILAGNGTGGNPSDNQISLHGGSNLIIGNYIGVAADGTTVISSANDGIDVSTGATSNIIGGVNPGEGNLIAGQAGGGVRIQNSATGTLVRGNTIWANGTGVAVMSGSGHLIQQNSIYGNTNLGIDLVGGTETNFVTANDVPGTWTGTDRDPDTGPNDLKNFPVLATATTNGTSTITITGSLNATSGRTYRIEFFSNPSVDAPSGHGEGRTYLGFVNVTADASGVAAISATLSGVSVPVGSSITATTTDATSNATSEFAANIAAVASNTAPVLTDTVVTLNPVSEDAGAPSGTVGTLVNTLVAGVSDADAGAQQGIAITAADATNGTWWYSTNNGSSWSLLGTPSTANARLLAADAGTRVYFQPNANYSGTIANAITFHAWDRTTGSNGGTVDLTPIFTVLDQFDAVAYSGNNGTVSWNGNWQEIGEADGPSSGNVIVATTGTVTGGPYLEIDLSTAGIGIARQVNLAGVTSATLSFTYEQDTNSAGGQLALEIFDGSSWTTLHTYNIDSDFFAGAVGVYQSFDISWYADANTQVRFRTIQAAGGDRFFVDDVRIDVGAGGATAFSTATDTAGLTVTAVNDAPVLDNSGAMSLTGINENATSNSGDLVSAIIASAGGNRITDVDSSAVEGIAVTALVSGNGTWQYSTNGGGTWNAVGAVSDSSALLLRANDRLRFVPDGLNADTPSLSFRAWDQTSGVQGTKVDVSTNGGTTAFSSAIETASLTVSAVNDAPVLADTVVTLNAVNEDAGAPVGAVGTLVNTLVGGVSDADSGAVKGIAITAADTTNGSWWYSTDNGGSWSALGGPTGASSRLLAADAGTRIYFQPSANYNGTQATAITFRAWDQSSGSNGGTADTTTNGGTTAFSTATDIASITVNPANDAPTGLPTISGTATEDQTLTANTGGIADADGLGSFGYQWLRNGVAIGGATASTYTLGDADVGTQISVRVSYTDGQGTAESVTSAQTAAVANLNDAPVGVPTISGTVTEDQTLTANTAGISDADGLGALGYQWLRNGAAIGGANASTYTLGDADVGTQISVRVSYTDGHGTTESVTSAQTAPVGNVNDAPVGVPTISGTVTENQTLSANTAGISDADGLGAFGYQWFRDGIAIGGATGSTYSLGAADVGTQISVQVSYIDGHGTSEGPLTSAQTAPVANANNAPVGLPTIGTATEDQTLTADTTGISDADGLGAFSYQWLRNGAVIGGAIGTTYTLGDADVGTQISVRVSFTDGYGTAESVTSAQTAPVVNINDAPVGMPTISGTATEDQTLTANAAGISDADGLGAFSYQWLRDGAVIGGATASTYTLGNVDVGTQISVRVTYTDAHGTSEGPLTSAQTAVVANVNDAPAGLPTITGTVTEDQTLTANTGGISDDDGLGAFGYQWLRNGVAIGGATASTYTLGDADVGTQISVRVSYTDGHGAAETVTSAQTAPVANVNDVPVGVPTIGGTVTEDQTLTANTGGISDDDGLGVFGYQWLRNGVAVGGATASTYTLGDADVGTQISVRVSYTDGHGTAEALTSAQTGAVTNINDIPVGVPAITGTATEDQSLAANIAGIADDDGLGAFGYQWLRDGVAIGGATASTYTLGDADVGTQIRVQVTYTDGHGTSEGPLTSAPTAPVANVNDAPLGVPTISGTVTEDQTLTGSTAGISDADGLGAFSYQWLRNGVAIGGAIAGTYTLGDADVGAQISVQVSYTDGHGTAETVISAQTAPVANVNDVPVGVPTISGTVTEDQTLTANTAGISDADGLGAFSYQWLRNGVAIGGATAGTYTLGDADVGTQISVQVSYTDGHGTAETVTSAQTAPVANTNDAPTGAVIIAGSATEDQTLTADTSTVADADGLGAFGYQWLRDGVAIGGATASTYTLGDADVGALIEVVVSYTDGLGALESLTSPAAGPVANVNDAPSLGANTLTLGQGDRVILSLANLSAGDVDNAAGGLTFTVSNLSGGRFELTSAPGVAIGSFTQADVAAGLVVFVHDGSRTAPAYTVLVSDGMLTDGPVTAGITFNPGALPIPPVPPPAPPVPAAEPEAMPETEREIARAPLPVRVIPALYSPGRAEPPDAQLNELELETPDFRRPIQPVANLNHFTPGPYVDPVLQLLAAAPANLEYLPTTPVDWHVRPAFPAAEEDARDRIEVLLEQVQIGGMALSVGVVWWASRISGLLGSLLASAPAWRHIDPLPVVGRDEDEDKKWYDSNDRDADANELAIDSVLEGARADGARHGGA